MQLAEVQGAQVGLPNPGRGLGYDGGCFCRSHHPPRVIHPVPPPPEKPPPCLPMPLHRLAPYLPAPAAANIALLGQHRPLYLCLHVKCCNVHCGMFATPSISTGAAVLAQCPDRIMLSNKNLLILFAM